MTISLAARRSRALSFAVALAAAALSVAAPAATQGRRAPAPPPAAPAAPGRGTGRPLEAAVIVVAIDGVRWQDVLGGVDESLARQRGVPRDEVVTAVTLVPHLYDRAISRGVVFGGARAPFVASGPNFVSLPGYREMFAGRADLSCQSNHCPPPTSPTFVDQLRNAPGFEQGDVAVIASWEEIANAVSADRGAAAVSVGRHGGATRDFFRRDPEASALLDRGAHAGMLPGRADYRPDAYTAPLALRYLERRHPRFLFIGLGDTDEYAHAADYRHYLRALHAADEVVGRVFDILDAAGPYGEAATVWVTSDHGRANDFFSHGGVSPESARSFLVVGGARVAARGHVSAPTHRLADLAPTFRVLFAMPPDTSPGAGAPLAELLAPPPLRVATP